MVLALWILLLTAAITAAASWTTGCSDAQLQYLESALLQAVQLGRTGAAIATGPNAAKG
jgi:hypothetical protein